MPDLRLRERERAATAGGIKERAALLRARLRVGTLTRDRLELAAYLGDEAARLVQLRREVDLEEPFALPWLTCPECGGDVWGRVTSAAVATGWPLSVLVDCEADENPLDHRYLQSDWRPVIDRVEAWARRELVVRPGWGESDDLVATVRGLERWGRLAMVRAALVAVYVAERRAASVHLQGQALLVRRACELVSAWLAGQSEAKAAAIRGVEWAGSLPSWALHLLRAAGWDDGAARSSAVKCVELALCLEGKGSVRSEVQAALIPWALAEAPR